MPDENVQESAPEQQESGQLPKPTISGASEVKPTSAESQKGAGLSEEDVRRIASEVWQSGKDRRWNDLEKQYGELNEFKTALDAVKGGEDPDKVMTTMELRRLQQEVQRLQGQPQAESAPQPSAGKQEVSDAAYQKAISLVEKAGMGNDPSTLALFKRQYSNDGDFIGTIAEHVMGNKAESQGGVSAAAIAQVPGKGVKQAGGEALSQEYVEKVTAARGNRAEVKRLQQHYREQGVPVDSIGFTF